MAKDTWALLGVFAAGFLLLAGLTIGVYDRLDARIETLDTKLSARIDNVETGLSAGIERVRTELGARIDDVETGLSARIEEVRTELGDGIKHVHIELSGEIEEVQAGQGAIRERLARLETLVGVAAQDPTAVVEDEADQIL